MPSDSVDISAPSGGDLAGTVYFDLYASADCGVADGDTPIYQSNSGNGEAVSGAGPVTKVSGDAPAQTASGSFSWKVTYDSTNPRQQDTESCNEVSTLTIDNDNTD